VLRRRRRRRRWWWWWGGEEARRRTFRKAARAAKRRSVAVVGGGIHGEPVWSTWHDNFTTYRPVNIASSVIKSSPSPPTARGRSSPEGPAKELHCGRVLTYTQTMHQTCLIVCDVFAMACGGYPDDLRALVNPIQTAAVKSSVGAMLC
jgi:hypothetical protein